MLFSFYLLFVMSLSKARSSVGPDQPDLVMSTCPILLTSIYHQYVSTCLVAMAPNPHYQFNYF
ncbi:hypothetical protein M758_4G060100 [Ceratodon purpureus]|uniref:Uncharacterized protein n=1 Tax=Ceratodon purpureus TaxID=3225 RepID=A0A8T0I627_CERPU|nr:hypothetical protein KC19_4G058500 [Ceratodon purpureus]KAG0618392.1 hypothetical protein M758_4G060100 [Ceratodon purpureus]